MRELVRLRYHLAAELKRNHRPTDLARAAQYLARFARGRLGGRRLMIADPFAVALVNVTGLKWASGRMPPLAVQHGASAMTSAEELAAPDRLAWTVWLQPRVVSDSTSV